jgi:hypothetical protein
MTLLVDTDVDISCRRKGANAPSKPLLRIFEKIIRLLMDRKSNFAFFLFSLIAPAILLFPVSSSICLAEVVTLGWDANPEPDLEGYVIYRNVDSPGPPYRFSSTLSEDDLANPLAPAVTITELNENTEYFIAVTAYDSEGNESYFSDQICVEIVDSVIENCTVSMSANGFSSSNIGSSGSGGNSGACFIESTAGDSNYFSIILGALIIIGIVVWIKIETIPYNTLGKNN